MELREFHNALRIMINLDMDELVKAGAIDDDFLEWTAFRGNPFMWMIRAEDARAQALWDLMKTRMK